MSVISLMAALIIITLNQPDIHVLILCTEWKRRLWLMHREPLHVNVNEIFNFKLEIVLHGLAVVTSIHHRHSFSIKGHCIWFNVFRDSANDFHWERRRCYQCMHPPEVNNHTSFSSSKQLSHIQPFLIYICILTMNSFSLFTPHFNRCRCCKAVTQIAPYAHKSQQSERLGMMQVFFLFCKDISHISCIDTFVGSQANVTKWLNHWRETYSLPTAVMSACLFNGSSGISAHHCVREPSTPSIIGKLWHNTPTECWPHFYKDVYNYLINRSVNPLTR